MSRRKISGRKHASRRDSPPENRAAKPLQQDDAALWAEVTKSLEPLKEGRDRLHFGPLLDEKPDLPDFPKPGGRSRPLAIDGLSKNPPAPKASHQNEQAKTGLAGKGRRSSVPEPGSFTSRELRRIERGHRRIEARLDLHGMNQGTAHHALKNFLLNCRSRRLLNVLVITGKGRSLPDDSFCHEGRQTGILRRMVPLWLSEPDLRPLVVSYGEAPRRHGGEGAVLIRLRRIR